MRTVERDSKGKSGGHPRPRNHAAGTLPDQEPDRLPVTESGLSIEPEDFGRQFLRDATEQDNFESSLPAEKIDPSAEGLTQVVSQDTLESAGQDDVDIPSSAALGTSNMDEGDPESDDDVDLISDNIHEGSLFDHPTARGGTRPPRVHTEEHEARGESSAQEEAMEAQRAVLLKLRPRLPATPRPRKRT